MVMPSLQNWVIQASDLNPSAHARMSPPSRHVPVYGEHPGRESAVAVVIYPAENGPSVVLIQRSTYVGVHSAQIAFPGGKVEDEDPHFLATAMRECMEETQIDLERNARYIGQLSPLFIPPSRFWVHPFVFVLNEAVPIALQEREAVSSLFLPLQYLCNPQNWTFKDVQNSGGTAYTVPAIELNAHTIWGATAMILSELEYIIHTNPRLCADLQL